MALSLTKAWDEAHRFIMREAALLVPIALTLMVMPSALFELVAPQRATAETAPGAWMLALPVFALFTLLGSLTITRLAFRDGLSVGEALRAGLRRLPVAIGASLILLGAAMLAMLPIAPMLPSAPGVRASVSGGAALFMMVYAAALVAGAFFLFVRLLLVNVVIMAEAVGPIDAMKRSFALSRGHFLKLTTLLIMFLVISIIVGSAVSLAGGAVFVGVGKLLGLEDIGHVLLALVSGAVSAAVSVYFVVTLTMIYRQIIGPDRPNLSRVFD